MNTYRNDPEGSENVEASKQAEREKFALQMQHKNDTELNSIGSEVWSESEIPFEVALAVVKRADFDSRIAASKALFFDLFKEIRSQNPITNEHGKYLNLTLEIHSYDDEHIVPLKCYFGSALDISNLQTAAELKEAISQFDPEKIRLKKIEQLTAELAKLTEFADIKTGL